MATYQDADLVLRLYDLRRETVMRKARSWFIGWKPTSADDVRSACSDTSREENAYVRQATSYWEMGASIANSGAVNQELYAKNSGEGVLFAIKCQSLKAKFPDAWTRTMPETEALIAASPVAQKKAEIFKARFAAG